MSFTVNKDEATDGSFTLPFKVLEDTGRENRQTSYSITLDIKGLEQAREATVVKEETVEEAVEEAGEKAE